MYFSTGKRRGRPRLPSIDKGAEARQKKKQRLLNTKTDLALAESVLGILYAQQLISAPLYEAGQFFAELGWRYHPCLGPYFRLRSCSWTPKISSSKNEPASLFTEKEEKVRTHAWQGAIAALQTTGPSPCRSVLKVVFYEHDLYEDSFLKDIKRNIHSLRTGLEALERYFTGEWKGTPSKHSYRAQGFSKATMPLLALRELPPASPRGYSS